jgi:hypothetical protein
MHFFQKSILIIVVSFLLTLIPIMPWFTPFIVCFLISIFISNKSNLEFLSGFLGVGLFWLIYMFFYLLISKVGLPTKVAAIFAANTGKEISTPLIIFFTFLLGGLLGGLSSLSGSLLSGRKSGKKNSYRLKVK